MAHGTQEGDDIISGINITPLVDIVLVLLIIFIVTASFVLRNKIPIELPKAQTGEASSAGLLNLAITKEGELFINGKPSRVEEIAKEVADARQKQKDATTPISAFISADTRTSYGMFANVIDTLRLANVTDIAIDTQPIQQGAEQQ